LTKRKGSGAETRIVAFRLGGEEYGIEIGQIREIIRRREITPMPGQSSYTEGVISVRGTIIPVINLRKRFHLPSENIDQQHIIIVEDEKNLVGMLVDNVSEVIPVPVEQIHTPPSVVTCMDSDYLRGICRLGERLLIFLNVKRVLKDVLSAEETVSALGTT
jgi:purine-binding chemotaxis protein CheW